MNNVKNSIGWCDFTWNVVTGCRRGCIYCYARRIHERFDPYVPFSHIEFHEERLLDKMPRKPSKIFVGSMSDIEYWEREWTEQIFDVCRQNKHHTFMFLSKNAWSYHNYKFPENIMQGLTITQTGVHDAIEVAKMFDYPHPYLSIEPLLGMVYGKYKKTPIELFIVGAMTGRGAVPPRPEWIQSVRDNVPADRIYWKKNIGKYLCR